MSIKALCAASFVILSALSQHVQAQTWTLSVTGRISQGVDFSGTFGVAGGDLFNSVFTQTVTASVDPSKWSRVFSYGMLGVGPSFTTSITVNGITKTYTTLSSTSGEQALSHNPYGSSGNDYVRSENVGLTSSGTGVQSNIVLRSDYTASFLQSSSYAQQTQVDLSNWDYYTLGGDSLFSTNGNGEQFYFYSSQQTIALNMIPTGGPGPDLPTIPAVPEPGTYAMLLAGMGLVGFAVRRKRMAA